MTFYDERISRFSRLTEVMLANRGYTDAYLEQMQACSRNSLMNITAFCNALHSAHGTGQEVTLLTDFDTDGAMSGITGFAGLAELGFSVNLYVPSVSGGYGFTAETIDDLMRQYPGTKVLVTADVGVACYGGIRRAKDYGLIVLVTDHHDVQKDELGRQLALPCADVIVNPMQDGDAYENKSICGAFVLYQCLEAYARMYGNPYVFEQVRRLRIFAGIGTVSDNMDMLHENRYLVKTAIDICRFVYSEGSDFIVSNIPGCAHYRRVFYGLYRLLCYLHETGKFDRERDIDEDLFGFYIAPMVNSVKRMDESLYMVYDIFFGNEQQKAVERLYMLNEKRKEAVSSEMERMLSVLEPYKPYVWFSESISGLRGLLAQKIRSVTGLPCLVVNPSDAFKGSGRAPAWYPFKDRLNAFASHIRGNIAAGHMHSFGVKLGDEDFAKQVFDFINADMAVSRPATQEEARPDFVIDTMGNGDTGIDIVAFCDYLRDIRKLAPFGPCFEAPCILLKMCPKSDILETRTMGGLKQHLKLTLQQGFEVIMWNHASDLERIKGMDKLELCGRLSLNVWGERRTVNFVGEPVLSGNEDRRYFEQVPVSSVPEQDIVCGDE